MCAGRARGATAQLSGAGSHLGSRPRAAGQVSGGGCTSHDAAVARTSHVSLRSVTDCWAVALGNGPLTSPAKPAPSPGRLPLPHHRLLSSPSPAGCWSCLALPPTLTAAAAKPTEPTSPARGGLCGRCCETSAASASLCVTCWSCCRPCSRGTTRSPPLQAATCCSSSRAYPPLRLVLPPSVGSTSV
jgi:hypothetical protein